MIVLGIDPGLANTGWGIIEERSGQVRCRAYGCIKTSAGSDLAVRLRHIADDVNAVVERYHPEEAAIEGVYFGANVRSAIPTAHARGAALVACSLCGVEVGEYTPMQIKQAVVGTGAADKAQVAYMVQRCFTWTMIQGRTMRRMPSVRRSATRIFDAPLS